MPDVAGELSRQAIPSSRVMVSHRGVPIASNSRTYAARVRSVADHDGRRRDRCHQDPVAADNFYATFAGGDQTSWRAATREDWVIGGNVHVVGSPDQVVDAFARLHAAGCDGVQVNFYDYLPDLEFFGARVLPLMMQAGLRRTPTGP